MISVAVMAHRRRRIWAQDLSRRLDAEVVWDRYDDRVETGLRSLQAYDRQASHHLVVQDDAVVCRDLVEGLELAVKVSEGRIVGLFWVRLPPDTHMAQIAQTADLAGCSWLACDTIGGGVAVVYPTAVLPDLIGLYQRGGYPTYDVRILRCARRLGIEMWHTRPCLVDHRPLGENPSLHHKAERVPRVADRFIGEDRSALDIDWTRGVFPARRK